MKYNYKNVVIYTCYGDMCIVGTNSTEYRANGIKDVNYSGIIEIPEKVAGKPVKEVGVCAFYSCNYITDVIIRAKITSIHTYAFGNCPVLKSINIPNTCTFIEHHSIFSYDNYNTTYEEVYGFNLGTIVVSFEKGSQISYLTHSIFGRKEHIVILLCDKIQPVYHEYGICVSYGDVKVYSSFPSFEFCGINTTEIHDMDCLYSYNIASKILDSFIDKSCGIHYNYNYKFTIFILLINK